MTLAPLVYSHLGVGGHVLAVVLTSVAAMAPQSRFATLFYRVWRGAHAAVDTECCSLGTPLSTPHMKLAVGTFQPGRDPCSQAQRSLLCAFPWSSGRKGSDFFVGSALYTHLTWLQHLLSIKGLCSPNWHTSTHARGNIWGWAKEKLFH